MSESTTSATSTVTADKVPRISVSLAAQGAGLTSSTSGSAPAVFTSDSPNLDSSTILQVACKVCGKGIVRDKKTICTMCGTVYHPGCAAPIKILPNGALQRCWGPKAGGRLSPSASVTLSGDDRSQLLDELMAAVRDEIKFEVMGALKEAIGQELKAELLKVMTKAVGTAVSKAFEDVNNKLTQEVDELKESVGVLQEARDISEAQIGGIVGDISTVSSRFELAQQSTSTRFDEIMSEVASIRVELGARSANVGNAAGEVGASEVLMDEVEDRMSRRRNVIMFGVPEPTGGDMITRKQKDVEAVSGIIKALSVADTTPVTSLRLGKFSEHLAFPRPLKVVFSSADFASNLIITASQKRSQRETSVLLGQMQIRQDLTENQRLRNKQLKLELARRKAEEGNPHLKIHTRNGVPRIVSVPPRATQGARGDGARPPM